MKKQNVVIVALISLVANTTYADMSSYFFPAKSEVKEFKSSQVKAPIEETSYIEGASFEEDFVVVENHLASTERFSPLVQEWEFNITFNPHFVAVAPALLDLVDLSYVRSKSHRDDGEAYKHWNIKSFKAIRGFFFQDPKAGFVAYINSDREFLPPALQHQAGPLMVIVFHGSINNADWFTNYQVNKTNLVEPEYKSLNTIGYAHSGFVRKYMSASDQVMSLVDERLKLMSPEERRQLKIYVTGHSQGAGLAQLATVHLVQYLRVNHPDLLDGGKTNVNVNRVNGWFLGAPAVFDESIGKKFVEDIIVGRHNMIRQNIRGDVVPNLAKPFGKTIAGYKGIGFLLYQSGLEALRKAAELNWKGFKQNVEEGELTFASTQLSMQFLKLLGSSPHFVAATEYRGHGFTPALVHTGVDQLTLDAYEQGQGKSFFGRIFGY